MDGNFSAEHMQCRTGEKDVHLSAGMAFMANPEEYKAHLKSGKESIQVCKTLCSQHYTSDLWDCTYSQVHATHTRPLNKQIPEGLTWMSQASEQPPAAMGSSFLLQW
jgi:hypothetical protein